MKLDDSRMEPILREIEVRARRARRGRMLIAVAGPPGSGKSTFADALAGAIIRRTVRIAEVVAQDGFHLDNAVLDARGLRARKGAPETFDVEDFWHLLRRLRRGTPDVIVPAFDRRLDRVDDEAAILPASTDTVVVEGNYLLLDMPPWDGLREFFHLTIMLTCAPETLRARLTRRWLDLGLTPEAAAARAEDNDMANAQTVWGRSVAADLLVSND